MGDAPKSTLPGVQILSQAFRSKDLGEPLTRVGFLFVAYIMTHVAVSDVYSFPIFTSLPLTAMNLGAYAFAFALIVLALVSKAELRPKAYLMLIAAAYAVILNFLPVVVFQPFYRIDSLSYTHYSAVLLLQGRNPYAESMIPSLTAFGVPPDAWSPLEAGGLFGTSPYPPLAFKQTPWLLAPFLLLWYWHRRPTGTRQAPLAFGGVAAGVFLLVNGPFLVWNPSAWAAAMFAPLTTLQAPTGLGLSTLAGYGYVFVSRDFFVAAEVGLLAILILGYHFHFERLEFTFWIFPALVLFVSYRMLQSYVVYWAPFLLIALWTWWYRSHANSDA